MKAITVTLTITLFILTSFFSNAQEIKIDHSFVNKVTALKEQKETVIKDEKEALSEEVMIISKKLEGNEISPIEAEKQKVAAAEKHALNIYNKTAIIDNKIALLERNGDVDVQKISFNLTLGDSDEANSGPPIHPRTYSNTVIAFGLNNAIVNGQSLNDSPYEIEGSRFFEIGHAWNTRVFKNAGWLRFKYGFSFQFNGLKPEGNTYLVTTTGTPVLEEYPLHLDKSKIRQDNLVIPLHFEFGSSKRIEKDGKTYFNSASGFKIGLGGYAGLNLNTIQKLKFEENGEDVKQKTKLNSTTNNFVYGLSGYIGWDTMSLFVKHDLNPIFKNGPKQRNVSVGLRIDFD